MPNVSITFRVDADLKQEAEAVCTQQRLPFAAPTQIPTSELTEIPLSRQAQKRLWQIIDAGDPEAQAKIERLLALRKRWDIREGGPAAECPLAVSPQSPVIGTDS